MSSTPGEQVPHSFFGRIFDYLDWKANPVLLRDLRLYARGRLLAISYLFVLAVLIVLAILYAIVASLEGMDGQALLSILSALLIIACGAVAPNLVFERFRAELTSRATELALMSPLTPARLVRGKLAGAWCVTLVIVSIAAPALITSYLLGGVGMLSVVGVAGAALLAGAVMPCVQLFLAASQHGKGMTRVVASLVFVGQVILMSAFASLINATFIRTASGRGVNIALTASAIIAALLLGQFLYFVTVGRLGAESEDRDAAPRLSLAFAAWFGFFAAAAIAFYLLNNGPAKDRMPLIEIASYAAAFAAYAFSSGFFIIAHTNPAPPRRPRDGGRAGLFRRALLMPGPRSLTVFFLANAVPLSLLAAGGLYNGLHRREAWCVLCASLAPFMAIAIGLCAYHHIVIRFFKEKRNPGLLPIVIVITNIVAGIAGVFIMIIAAYIEPLKGMYDAIVGLTPVGLIYAGMGPRYQAMESGVYGIAAMLVLLLALLPIVFGKRDGGGGGREASSNGTS